MTTEPSPPDRPIAGWLKPLRGVIRRIRLLKQIILLRRKLVLGANVNFGRHTELRCPEFVRFGDNVNVGAWFVAETNLDIGPDVLISSKVSFVGNDHIFSDPSKTIYFQGRQPPSTVVLEGDNLIGFGTIIVGDVTIGRGCIVGAGSVVTKSLPANTICAGVPARVIKSRYS